MVGGGETDVRRPQAKTLTLSLDDDENNPGMSILEQMKYSERREKFIKNLKGAIIGGQQYKKTVIKQPSTTSMTKRAVGSRSKMLKSKKAIDVFQGLQILEDYNKQED